MTGLLHLESEIAALEAKITTLRRERPKGEFAIGYRDGSLKALEALVEALSSERTAGRREITTSRFKAIADSLLAEANDRYANLIKRMRK